MTVDQLRSNRHFDCLFRLNLSSSADYSSVYYLYVCVT